MFGMPPFKTEDILAIYYVCPRCSTENTISVDKSEVRRLPTGSCKSCKTVVNINSLVEHYGPEDRSKFYVHCIEFFCEDCGRRSLIRNESHTRNFWRFADPSDEWKPEEEREKEHLHVSMSKLPHDVSCGHCECPHIVYY